MTDSQPEKRGSLPRPGKRPGGRIPRPRNRPAPSPDTGEFGETRVNEPSDVAEAQQPPSVRQLRSNAGQPLQDRFDATITDESIATPAAPASTVAGNRYEILRQIARGGMGEVWLAVDRKLKGRYVAIKRLTEDALQSPKLRQRFEAEAQAMAKLSHPCIIQVSDVGADASGPFICMEYVAGPPRQREDWQGNLPAPPMNLQEYVEAHGALPLPDALAQTRRLCQAVADAHAAGVIHRDIKPANVLLDAKLQPRLIDFGLARDLQPAESQHTMAGSSMLTIGYGAPEQESDASQADERADVYALGGVLWFLVTGQNPRFFRASDAPEEIRDLLTAALARDRDQRIQAVTELEKQLEKIGQQTAPVQKKVAEGFADEQLTSLMKCLEGERRAGVCPLCGHLHEPLPTSVKQRQFCAGCGTSLWLKCQKCQSQSSAIGLRRIPLIPLWERFCSKCGEDLLSLPLTHIRTAVETLQQVRAAVAVDVNKAHLLAGLVSESLECLIRQAGTDFSVGRIAEIRTAVENELNQLRQNASNYAATSEEGAWKAAIQADTREAMEGYLKKWPTGRHAWEIQRRLEEILLNADVQSRLQRKEYAGLLPDVARLILMNDVARKRWTEEKLSQLLKRDSAPESCLAYLRICPDGNAADEAKAVVSPYLRSRLLRTSGNRQLRTEYTAFRSADDKSDDESRVMNLSLLCWGILGILFGLPLIGFGILTDMPPVMVAGIVAAGGCFLMGVLYCAAGGRRADFGPLPAPAHLLPTFAVPDAWRPMTKETDKS
ncbi:MAG: protein kinase [Planctomycetaceae bacterium]|nr:protein kinase [Planctomycetaceae bacterium]